MSKIISALIKVRDYFDLAKCPPRGHFVFSERATKLADEVSDLANYLEGKDDAMSNGLKDAASKLNEAADKLRVWIE